ncbi:TPA: hypothetical protein DCL28_01950 [Candidatus Komeilibacteria bacterium]|nr:hypothetical protein [Candidatus Komeilibacteria bacterium]
MALSNAVPLPLVVTIGLTKDHLFAMISIIMKTTTKNTAFFAKLNNSAIIGIIIIIALVMVVS